MQTIICKIWKIQLCTVCRT